MKALPARSCVSACVCERDRDYVHHVQLCSYLNLKGEEAREKISCTRGNSPFGKLMKAVNTGRGSH